METDKNLILKYLYNKKIESNEETIKKTLKELINEMHCNGYGLPEYKTHSKRFSMLLKRFLLKGYLKTDWIVDEKQRRQKIVRNSEHQIIYMADDKVIQKIRNYLEAKGQKMDGGFFVLDFK
jgi:hypothetical protein